MQPTNVDDLLQFKDYSSASSASSPPAQISVNSPTSQAGKSGRLRGDPLSDLVYDMTSIPQSGNINTSGGSGGGGGNFNDGDETTTAGGNKLSFLTIDYYQQFFNVDTFMVLERITNSMLPKRAGSDYLRKTIGQNPDLYGPFWINITLIFLIAISGNIASYLQHANENYHWRYNFHLVSYAATCIFLYVNVLPAALWALFKYSIKPLQEGLETESAGYTPSLLSLMCLYGYSLSIYIPVSILWVIQISLLQWLLVITAALLSGSVLILVLTPALRNSQLSPFLMFGILGAHFLLAAGFMLYFFHVPSSTDASTPVAVTAAPLIAKSVTKLIKETVNAAASNGTNVAG